MIEITEAHLAQIAHCLPKQRGNVSLSNLSVLNAILYVAQNGCKWRGLPRRFGNWHTVYMRMNRWSRSGVLDRVFEELQRARLVRIQVTIEAAGALEGATVPSAGGERAASAARKPPAVRGAAPNLIWVPRMSERT